MQALIINKNAICCGSKHWHYISRHLFVTQVDTTQGYIQSRYNVAGILDQLVQVRHLAAFLKLIHQVQLQMTQLIRYGHVYTHSQGL